MTELKHFKRGKASEEEIGAKVLQIKTDSIRPNRAQPRAEFDQNALIRLADSIRRYGILQPLTVRASDPEDIYEYELIAGERRLRAAKMLGYLTVPCVIMEVNEELSAELAMIENLLRENLNMFEQAYGFKRLIEGHHMTQEEVARRLSMSQSAVANKLRLLRLTYEEQRLILDAGLTERHARAVLRIEHPQRRLSVLQYAAEHKLTVQATEEYIEGSLLMEEPPANQPTAVTPVREDAFRREREMMDLVRRLRKKVDGWNRGGSPVSMSVINGLKGVEILLRFPKEDEELISQ